MKKAKLNFKKFQEYIANDKGVQEQISEIVNLKMEKNKEKLINNFLSHPISSEISSGPSASNSSGTLSGYGNLFSFIGFSSGDNPVERWANFLKQAIMLQKNKIDISVGGSNIIFKLKISSISAEDLRTISPMPWEGGRSWIEAIERGISGFSFYISQSGKGRSGGGVQSKNSKKSTGNYKSVPYWSKIWSEFLKDISRD